MSYKKLIVARIYDDYKQLIGCGVYSSRTKRTECKSINEVLIMLKNEEIDNMKLMKSGQIEGKSYGIQEFNSITAVRYRGGNAVDVINPKIFILSFDDKQMYSVIRPDGGPDSMSKDTIKEMIDTAKAKPSNFIINYGEIEELGKYTIFGARGLGEYVVRHLSKVTGYENFRGERLEIPNDYTAEISGRESKQNGVCIHLRIHKTIDITKYATPNEYAFIDRDNDGYYIDRGIHPKEYDRVLSNYMSHFDSFNTNKQAIENVSDKYFLSLGDKRWLSANHYLDLDIPFSNKRDYSLNDVYSIINIILSILVRR